MKKTSITPSFAQFVHNAVEKELLELHTCMPGKIKEYDEDTQKAEITPLLKRKFKDSNDTIIDIPTCVNVPVHHLSCNAGKTFLHMPIKIGDPGMLIFTERSMDNYLSSSPGEDGELRPLYHNNIRHHDLSDAWFMPGILPFTIALQNVSANDIIIKNDQLTLTIDPDGKISISNGSNELITVLLSLIQNLINARTITMMGSQPFIATTIDALTENQDKLTTFKI